MPYFMFPDFQKWQPKRLFQPESTIDVGKLNFEMNENEFKSRRRSVGKLNNPWENNQQKQSGKPRSRRPSKVL